MIITPLGWEVVFNGAEPIHAESLENFYQAFKPCGLRKAALMPCYGLAEATLYVSGSEYLQGYHVENFSDKKLKQNKIKNIVSCGKPLQDVRIVNPETCELCSEDEIGEIWLQGRSVAKGYWGLEEETQKTFRAEIVGGSRGDFYLRTGDLGFLYQNELYITGRIKDLIIIHGFNYYPQDIESTITHVHPAMRKGAIAAFSIDKNDEEKLIIVAEVQPSENYSKIAETIVQTVFAEYECAVYAITFIAPRTLPKTTSGKLRRKYTKELFESHQLNSVFEWTQTEKSSAKSSSDGDTQLELELQEMLSELLKRPVSVDENLAGLGVDSLLAMQLISRVRDKYDLELPIHSLFGCRNLRELAKIIEEAKNSS